MPRLSRTVFAGIPHHITQRGNRREEVFFADDDRSVYLDWLKEYCDKHRVEILAYCLMTNHLHLVAIPSTEEGLQRVLKPLHMRNESIGCAAGRGTCGKGVFSRRRWMNRICGRRFVMSNAIPCGRAWWRKQRTITGQVPRPIAD